MDEITIDLQLISGISHFDDHPEVTHWVVIDDQVRGFAPHLADHLFVTESSRGLTGEMGPDLRTMLAYHSMTGQTRATLPPANMD